MKSSLLHVSVTVAGQLALGVSLLAFMGACATTQETMNEGLLMFQNKPIDQLVKVFGTPTRTAPAAEHDAHLLYIWARRADPPNYSRDDYVMRKTADDGYTYSPPPQPAVPALACLIAALVAADDVIVSVKWSETSSHGCWRYARALRRHLEILS